MRLPKLRGSLRAGPTTLSQPDEWLVQALTGGSSFSGQSVTVNGALGLAPFWRGVNLLSGAVGMMPCKVYRPTADGREQVPRASRPSSLLRDRPNENMAADEFWFIVESHQETWGNSFVWKERGADGRIANLWPLNPSRVQVGQLSDGRLRYVVDGQMDSPLTNVDILHVRALSRDGVVGYSPIQMHRQTLGSALARQEFQGRFWANDATPGVTLIHPNKLNPEAVDRLRALWDDRQKGVNKARATAVLGESVKVETMTMPLQDAQFIEQARYSATEQALILGVPPYMVAGDSGGTSLQYSTTEAQSLDLLKWSLAPRLVRLQNCVTQDPDLMPTSWFAEFETGAVMRATTMERYSAWAVAPHLTIDEMRAMDNLPPLPDGKGAELSKSSPVNPPDNQQPNDKPANGDTKQ